MLTTEQIKNAINLVTGANHIVVTAHKSPDGDAVGSLLGLSGLLKNLGKNVTPILPDSVPEFLQWMQGFDDILIFEEKPAEASNIIREADLIFSLDYNSLSRVGVEMEKALRSSHAPFILIDHHQQPEAFAAVTYSDTASCSTAQLIYEMAEQCDWLSHLDNATAECIYCGIMTDSGSFRFPAVTPKTHIIAANLIESGMDHAKVHRMVYDTNLPERLKLVGYALNDKLEHLEDASTAIISLSLEELKRFNHRQGDTEGLVNQALSIKGVNLAAFFREGSNEIKISFRSKGKFDVNKFSRENWNGGGHMNAAGGMSNLSLHDALIKFRNQVAELKNEINNS